MQITSKPIRRHQYEENFSPHKSMRFLTQVAHPRFNPSGFPKTEDCGPTCLVMALAALGIPSPSWPDGQPVTGAQEMIDGARFSMFSDASGRPTDTKKSGFLPTSDGCWTYHPEARQTLTNLGDLERGAKNVGAATYRVSLDHIRSCPDPLILAGNPNLPGAYGARAGIDYQGGHFILLPRGGRSKKWHTVFDPLSLQGPLRISTSELWAFLSADIFAGDLGLALTRREERIHSPGKDT
jgi:hypothetical protein